MTPKVPNVVLNNGLKMPIFGLGTWNSPKGDVARAVQEAIDMGYRSIDCAHVYGNEDEVGDGIAASVNNGVVKREDVFVTSKLWNTFHRPDLVRGAMETTLKNLKLDYVDLYLIHWPMAYKEDGDMFPAGPDGKTQYSDVDYIDTWKELEKLVEAGLAKSIGLSNFNSKQIDRVLSIAKIKPVVNQVECHPYLAQKKLFAFCKNRDVALTGYSPLGSPARPWVQSSDPVILEEEAIKQLAEKYNKTTAQILLRWQVQLGHIVIPKSTNKGRIAENFNIFDFELSEPDMETISALDRNLRFVPLDKVTDHKYHPFANDEY